MPRAHRQYAPGSVWHITHRCLNQEFLLKFDRDRLRWKYWLYQARKRYGLSILNYIATSNHIHLLVCDSGHNVICRSMQLVAGRVAQEFNVRKSRQGAFWQDRYFATAVSTDAHLHQCIVYIDLNMVRAGIVSHPDQWKVSGYNEIQKPISRYRLIDFETLCQLTGIEDRAALREQHRIWVDERLAAGNLIRESQWTDVEKVGP